MEDLAKLGVLAASVWVAVRIHQARKFAVPLDLAFKHPMASMAELVEMARAGLQPGNVVPFKQA